MTPSGVVRAVRAVAVVVGLVAVIRLAGALVDPGARGLVLVAVVLSMLLIGAVMLAVAGRLRRWAAQVARLRPGAVVIPGYTTAETRVEARLLGAPERGWNQMGGTPVAIAALPDRFEVWARGEDRPRWVVLRRPEFAPMAVRGSIGVRRPPSLRLVDGRAQVTLAPAYAALRGTVVGSRADLARALAELGAPQSSMM